MVNDIAKGLTLLALIGALLFSAVGGFVGWMVSDHNSKMSSRLQGVYTIWVGDSAYSSGHQANKYNKNGDMFEFVDINKNQKKIVPFHSLYEIEINKVTDEDL